MASFPVPKQGVGGEIRVQRKLREAICTQIRKNPWNRLFPNGKWRQIEYNILSTSFQVWMCEGVGLI